MPLPDKSNRLSSDQQKNKTKQQHIWCEDCGKYTFDQTRHFQSETHNRHQQSNLDKVHTASRAASLTTPHFDVGTLVGVEVIVNKKTYIKLKVNRNENLQKQIKDLLRTYFFPDTSFS